MGVFSGMKEAKSWQSGNYIKEGRYLFEILRLKHIESQKKKGKELFIAELRVVESEQTGDKKPHAVGSEVSFVVNLNGDYPDYALGDVRDFLYAAYCAWALDKGEDPPALEDIGEEATLYALSEESPLAGVRVTDYAWDKQREAKNPITKHKWGVPGVEDDEDGDE